MCCACIWSQPGIWIYWPALSRGWGWRDESLYIQKFLSFWGFQLPRMHQFLKWDFKLQYFSPFNEGLGFFLYFSLFASYVKPSAVYILSLWVLSPFLYFVSFCLSLCVNNPGIWKFDLEVALCLGWVQWLASTARLGGPVTPLILELIFRVDFPRAEWVQEAGMALPPSMHTSSFAGMCCCAAVA